MKRNKSQKKSKSKILIVKEAEAGTYAVLNYYYKPDLFLILSAEVRDCI